MGQVLYTSELPLIELGFDTGLSAEQGHGCKILHDLFCHQSWNVLLAGTYVTIFLTIHDTHSHLWFILGLIGVLTPQWSSPSTCEARMIPRSWLFISIWDIVFDDKTTGGKKNATDPLPGCCSGFFFLVSILSNKVTYLAAFRKWHTGHLKQAHNTVSLMAS